ncbi:DabB protein [Emticicia aquatilis]|uniref:DabB protein n=2 Tax=Emticicia aquatilis TaxID=1537369 RepID=A0A916Z060_9BACT|nr:DabB protein [Emticicia aquatilis]
MEIYKYKALKIQKMNKSTRRKFLKTNAIAPLAFTTAFASEKVIKSELFVHHVYFWLKNPNSEADKAKLIEGLEALSKVSEIKMAHIGTPASTNRSVIEKGYAVSWLLFFENLEEEEIYQKHPIHLKFVADYSHLWEKVIVYDSVGTKRKG